MATGQVATTLLLAVSMTLMVLELPLITYRRLSSGDSVALQGWVPTVTVVTTVPLAASITATLPAVCSTA